MSFTVNASDPAQWRRLGLAEFAEFEDSITERNVGKDYGEWFFVPDEPLPTGERVIYFGSWDSDHGPGASAHTHATLFNMASEEGLADFAERVRDLESQPEQDDQFEPDDSPDATRHHPAPTADTRWEGVANALLTPAASGPSSRPRCGGNPKP